MNRNAKGISTNCGIFLLGPSSDSRSTGGVHQEDLDPTTVGSHLTHVSVVRKATLVRFTSHLASLLKSLGDRPISP